MGGEKKISKKCKNNCKSKDEAKKKLPRPKKAISIRHSAPAASGASRANKGSPVDKRGRSQNRRCEQAVIGSDDEPKEIKENDDDLPPAEDKVADCARHRRKRARSAKARSRSRSRRAGRSHTRSRSRRRRS